MKKLIFITHPSVIIDPNVPIDTWGLSKEGFKAIDRLLEMDFINDIDVVCSSSELKAYTVAEKLSEKIGMEFGDKYKMECLKEIKNRTFIPPSEYGVATKNWFDNPSEKVNGWESRDEAQVRMVNCVAGLVNILKKDTVAIVGHGGTGTLLKCVIKNVQPTQEEDQPGQGCYFIADWVGQKLLSDWEKF